jgi:hypothetical protein
MQVACVHYLLLGETKESSMGVIDKCTYTLTCANCGTTESSSVLDHGSGWGGPSWDADTSFTGFNTEWSGGDKKEPVLQSTSCKQCGNPATVTSRYTQ